MMFFKNKSRQKLFFREFIGTQPKFNLIILHGVNEHSGRYLDLILAFQKEFQGKLNIFAYDHRGHGQSEGKRGFINKFTDYSDDLDDFILYLQNYNKSVNLPFIIFAHSMGGLVALDYVINHKQKLDRFHIKGLILNAPGLIPSVQVAWWKELFTPIISLLWPAFSLPTPELGYKGDKLCYDRLTARWFNEYNKARKRITTNLRSIDLPVLIFHSNKDEIASIEGSKILYKNISSKKGKLEIINSFVHAWFDIEAPDNEKICTIIAHKINEFFRKEI